MTKSHTKRALTAALLVSALSVPASVGWAQPATPAAKPAAATGLPAWSIASKDQAADPAVRFGRLPNGMRYALMHNETPKGAGAIRFAFNIGSKEETDAERGYAHFLEHMAFNGSTNIPEGKLVPMLERLGLSFGADSNAETSLDHTIYQLDLPKADAATIDSGLTMMREIASNLTIAPGAVNREKGIIQSEARVRDTFGRRQGEAQVRTLFPLNRIGDRLTITPEVVGKTTAPGVRAFYEGYYRPERATLVMVGDFDVNAVEKLIRERFANWKPKGKARAAYVPPAPRPAGVGYSLFVDPSVPESVQLQRASAYEAPRNDMAEAKEDILEAVASAALTNRINALSRSASSPILGGGAGGGDLFRSGYAYGLAVSAKEGKWAEALALAEQEMRRANQYGFTADEIAEAKARVETGLTNAIKQAPARPSGALAQALAVASTDNELFQSPEQGLEQYRALEQAITPDAVTAAFRTAWGAGPTAVLVSTKTAVPGGQQRVAEVLGQSARVAVTAPVEKVTKAFAYNDFGPAGAIVTDRRIDDLGIREIRFANGVALNIKKTDFEPGRIAFRVETGRGVSMFPSDKQGLAIAYGTMAGIDGLKAHDIDELRRITAGRQVSYGLAATPGALTASGVTTPADLDFQMKLSAAKVSASAWGPDAAAQWAGIAPVIAKTIVSDPMQLTQSMLVATLASGDARVGITDPALLSAVTLDQVKAVVQPQLDNAPIEIAVVGDVDEAAAIKAVAQSFGALPKRQPLEQAVTIAPIKFTADRTTRVLRHNGTAEQGVVALAWPTTDDKDFRATVARELLASAMQLRLLDVVREKLGATYTPNADSVSSNLYDGFGLMLTLAPSQPSAMDTVSKAMRDIAASLAAAPISEDELLRARKPRLEALDRAQRQNAAWLGTVSDAQSRPVVLDRWRTRKAVMSSLTAADLQAEAKKWLTAQPLEIRALPQGK